MRISAMGHRFVNDILRYLAKGGFLKAVAKLSGATALGQVVSVLASLILTRIYTPGDFGFLAIFTALLTQLMVFVSFRYEWAIPPAKDDETAFDLVLLCLGLVVLVTAGTAVGVLMGATQIATWVNLPGIAQYLYLLPIAVFFVGVLSDFQLLGVAQERVQFVSQITNC
jgi:O-antigen/teichoic acid export membrane protein